MNSHSAGIRALTAVSLTIATLPLTAQERGPRETDTAARSTASEYVDVDQLARKLVDAAAVKDGELLLISGGAHDADVLESLAVEARRRGAFPLVEYISDSLEQRLLLDVPAERAGEPNAFILKVAESLDVAIILENGLAQSLFEGADPQRIAARMEALSAESRAFRDNDVRVVEVGNQLYPTPWRAQQYRMSEAALAKTFWEGINVDYGSLEERGNELKQLLEVAQEIRLTHPDGTELTMQTGDRTVLVSDGVISDADVRQGGAAVTVYLPAGEVFTTPVPGSAHGRLVSRGQLFNGKVIEQLEVVFEGGKVTSMTGSGPGFEELKARYDAIDDTGKELLGVLDVGINPSIRLPTESELGNWVPSGSVTVVIGNNDWAGGDNASAFLFPAFLPGSTLTVDGDAIVENGELKL